MPDSDVARITASVPSWSGANLSSSMTISAWPSSVSLMSEIVPIGWPDTITKLPFTSWPAFWKTARTSYLPEEPKRRIARMTIAATTAAAARARASMLTPPPSSAG
jgi:hypothetical protein